MLGAAAGAWAPLVPFAKARLGLDDGGLGLLLLCLGAGSIVAMPLAGALAARFGCRPVVTAAATLAAGVFPMLVLAPSPATLGPALFASGAAAGSMDCVINMQAIVVEREAGTPLMSGFHALYSLGNVAGALAVSALVGLGVAPLAIASVVGLAILVAALSAWPGLLAQREPAGGGGFSLPHGGVVLIGAFCFIVFLTEGSALDWSAVLLRADEGARASEAGLAFAAFSAAMTGGRLVGDRIVARFGRRRVVAAGALASALGLTVAASGHNWPAAVGGYALVGAGCANIVPVLFTLTGRQTAMPESAAVAAVSMLGYAGLLSGPAGIGFLARATNLPLALTAVSVLLLIVAAGAARLPA